MPPSRSCRSSARRAAVSPDGEARGRLVKQQQHRFDAERAGDLDDALLSQRERASELVDLVAEPDTLDLPRGFREQPCLVGAVEPQHAGDGAGLPTQMRADRHVFQHGHVGYQLDVLEGARNAEADDLLRRRIVDMLAEEGDGAAGRGQHARDQVEGRALAGAVGADQCHDFSGLHVEADVIDRDHAAKGASRSAAVPQARWVNACARAVSRRVLAAI